MGALKARYNFLFRSTKGLILVAIALIALIRSHGRVWNQGHCDSNLRYGYC
jgi:hypothetical protein